MGYWHIIGDALALPSFVSSIFWVNLHESHFDIMDNNPKFEAQLINLKNNCSPLLFHLKGLYETEREVVLMSGDVLLLICYYMT